MKAIAPSKIGFSRGTPLVLTAHPRHNAARRVMVTPRANMFTDVSKYLSEAASQIFSLKDDNVPWQHAPFSGRITHHEEVTRLRALADEVRAARQHLEGSVDQASDDEAPAQAATVSQDYVKEAIDRVFGHNFKGDATEPAKYFSTGYGQPALTQRQLRNEISKLRRFETVVKGAIETAEAKK